MEKFQGEKVKTGEEEAKGRQQMMRRSKVNEVYCLGYETYQPMEVYLSS